MTEQTLSEEPGARVGIFPRQPRGLYTLVFTEMWERASFYGMRALLVLYMTDLVINGGLGLDDVSATAIYGLYAASVYLLALPGGWIADRLTGAYRAVWAGGLVIMAGHFTLAVPEDWSFFPGLVLVAVGTGLLKPSVSAMVGTLYPPRDPRRDSGFTMFYMGINLGAALGPIVCGGLGQSPAFGWHWGFGAAGVAMALGLVQLGINRNRLANVGLPPDMTSPEAPRARRRDLVITTIALALGALCLGLVFSGVWQVDPVFLAQSSAYVIAAVAGAWMAKILFRGGLDGREYRSVLMLLALIVASALFWAGFEQGGSSLNLFAERFTNRETLGFEIPASWYQSLNPIFILVLAPVFAHLWLVLVRRGIILSAPAKFAGGLVFMGLGFAVMALAALSIQEGKQAVPMWLVMTYLLHTTGELMLSPVGLSAITRHSPVRHVGQMMGLWFISASLGNLIAGLVAGGISESGLQDMPTLFAGIAVAGIAGGLVMALFARPLARLVGEFARREPGAPLMPPMP